MVEFSEEEIRRYSRHIILKEVGGKGQKKLREARVLSGRRPRIILPPPGSERSG